MRVGHPCGASHLAKKSMRAYCSAKPDARAFKAYCEAAEAGEVFMVETFFHRYGNAFVNAIHEGGDALIGAIRGKHPRIIDILVEHEAFLNMPLSGDQNYLSFAALVSDEKTVACLLRHGMKPDALCMHRAAGITSSIAMLDQFLDHGGDINARGPHGETPLASAVHMLKAALQRNKKVTLQSDKQDPEHYRRVIRHITGKGGWAEGKELAAEMVELGETEMVELIQKADKLRKDTIAAVAHAGQTVTPLQKMRVNKRGPKR